MSMQKDDIKLPILDSMHDFGQESGVITNNLINVISNYLNANYGYNLNSITQLGDLSSLVTDGVVTSVKSNFERNSESYIQDLKKMGKLLPENTLTYKQIIEDASGERKLWAKYRDLFGAVDIIKIHPGEFSFAEMAGKKATDLESKTKYQNMLADFILTFYFPENQEDPRITFDANTGVLGKIFSEITQMKCAITAANIGDSASTTTSTLNGRVEAIFTETIPNSGVHVMNSNLYTKDQFALSYKNEGFSNKNFYGFSLNINNVRIPFSASQNQGASISYLCDLIEAIADKEDPSDLKGRTLNVLQIGKYLKSIGEDLESISTTAGVDIKFALLALLYDLKRTGDYEQVNAAMQVQNFYPNTIIATKDVLCSTYAREMRMPCCFHFDESLYLFRFTKGAYLPTPQGLYLKTRLEAADVLNNLSKILWINKSQTGIVNELTIQNNIFSSLTLSGCFVPTSLKNMNAGSELYKMSQKFAIVFLRIKMFDMAVQLNQISGITKNLNDAINFATKYYELLQYFINKTDWAIVEGASVSPDSVGVDLANSRLSIFINGETTDLTSILREIDDEYDNDAQTKVAREITKLIENQGQLKMWIEKGGVAENATGFSLTFRNDNLFFPLENVNVFAKARISLFNYNYDAFVDLFVSLYSFHEELLKSQLSETLSRRAPYTILEKFQVFLSKLETLRDNLQSTLIIDLISNVCAAYNKLKEVFSVALNEGKTDQVNLKQTIAELIQLNKHQATFQEDNPETSLENIYTRIIVLPELSSYRDYYVDPNNCLGLSFPKNIASNKKGGGEQIGGSQSQEQYFEINDAFREICGDAEALLNSVYSTYFPFENVLQNIKESIILDKGDTLRTLHVQVYNAFKGARDYSIAYSSRNPQLPFIAIINANADSINHILDTVSSMDQATIVNLVNNFVQLLTVGYVSPTFKTFFSMLLTDDETKNHLMISYNVIASKWAVALQAIQELDSYEDNYGIMLMSFILSFNVDGYNALTVTITEYISNSENQIHFQFFAKIWNFLLINEKYSFLMNLCVLSGFNDQMNNNRSYFGFNLKSELKRLLQSNFKKYETGADWGSLIGQSLQVYYTNFSKIMNLPTDAQYMGGKKRRCNKKTIKKGKARKIKRTLKHKNAKKNTIKKSKYLKINGNKPEFYKEE